MDVTASEVRQRLRAGQNVAGLLEPAVIEYIREHGLYGYVSDEATRHGGQAP